MRRLTTGLLAVALAIAVTGLVTTVARASGDEPEARKSIATGTATVERKTLVERESVDGKLGFGEARAVVNRGQGTVTKLAEEGTVVERNGLLYALDGKAVRLLYGDTPAYRRLAADTADGADVEQLEANLVAMGHAKGLISKPNAHWDEATTAAVKRWEKALGLDQDGAIDDGEIVFLPGAARVASHKLAIGAVGQPGSDVITVTGTERQVTIELDARKQRLAQQGAKVEVELPDGSTAVGTIAKVGTVATSDNDGGNGGNDDGGSQGSESKPKITVVVTLDHSGAGPGLDGAPVKVLLTRDSRVGVLAVPVNALLALGDGGYGVEVAQPGGRTRVVAVETGLFSRGWVEVQGNGLSEGMKVVTPK